MSNILLRQASSKLHNSFPMVFPQIAVHLLQLLIPLKRNHYSRSLNSKYGGCAWRQTGRTCHSICIDSVFEQMQNSLVLHFHCTFHIPFDKLQEWGYFLLEQYSSYIHFQMHTCTQSIITQDFVHGDRERFLQHASTEDIFEETGYCSVIDQLQLSCC